MPRLTVTDFRTGKPLSEGDPGYEENYNALMYSRLVAQLIHALNYESVSEARKVVKLLKQHDCVRALWQEFCDSITDETPWEDVLWAIWTLKLTTGQRFTTRPGVTPSGVAVEIQDWGNFFETKRRYDELLAKFHKEHYGQDPLEGELGIVRKGLYYKRPKTNEQ